MTVLDIGAHHGLYTLLAARRVGPRGKVVAFEPSPREKRKLLLNMRLNRLRNIQVSACALGNCEGDAELYLVDGKDAASNSHRPPNVAEPRGQFESAKQCWIALRDTTEAERW